LDNEITQIPNFLNIRPVETEFHADRHEEANGRFSQFFERA
jgi:hypothetical protein